MILPEKPAWQWIICSLMWKLENWQTELQGGNWISRETNRRPGSWIAFISCKCMQWSCNPPSFLVYKISLYYLFIYGWKVRVSQSQSLLSKLNWFNILQWGVLNESHIIKCHRHLLTQFSPCSNKTGIIPLGPTWNYHLFFSPFWFHWCLCAWEAAWWKINLRKAEESRGMWWGMENTR